MVAGIGIPIKLLHESKGLVVSLELKTGQTYRGRLVAIEDNMNLQLKDVTVTARDGQISPLETCFLRGSNIRFIVVPDNLRHAPLFKAPGTGAGGFGGTGAKRARTAAVAAATRKN